VGDGEVGEVLQVLRAAGGALHRAEVGERADRHLDARESHDDRIRPERRERELAGYPRQPRRARSLRSGSPAFHAAISSSVRSRAIVLTWRPRMPGGATDHAPLVVEAGWRRGFLGARPGTTIALI
jgi:hypothetical protein